MAQCCSDIFFRCAKPTPALRSVWFGSNREKLQTWNKRHFSLNKTFVVLPPHFFFLAGRFFPQWPPMTMTSAHIPWRMPHPKTSLLRWKTAASRSEKQSNGKLVSCYNKTLHTQLKDTSTRTKSRFLPVLRAQDPLQHILSTNLFCFNIPKCFRVPISAELYSWGVNENVPIYSDRQIQRNWVHQCSVTFPRLSTRDHSWRLKEKEKFFFVDIVEF